MRSEVDNVINIPTSLKGKFFKYWFEFLRPYHKLTDREIDVIASFTKHRYNLSKVIQDPEILDRVTMGEDTKRKIREECNITQAHFQVIMTKLKKSKVIEDGRINPKYIPRLENDSNNFQLLLSFDLQ